MTSPVRSATQNVETASLLSGRWNALGLTRLFVALNFPDWVKYRAISVWPHAR